MVLLQIPARAPPSGYSRDDCVVNKQTLTEHAVYDPTGTVVLSLCRQLVDKAT